MGQIFLKHAKWSYIGSIPHEIDLCFFGMFMISNGIKVFIIEVSILEKIK